MVANSILKIVPLAQSVALVGENVKFAKKKGKDIEDILGTGVKNIVGAKLISETAKFTGSF